MADSHLDIGRIIMQANYLLETDRSSASKSLFDMERKQYQDQIKELIQTVQTLLQANITLGQKQKDSEEKARKDKEASEQKIAELQAKLDKLEGEVKGKSSLDRMAVPI